MLQSYTFQANQEPKCLQFFYHMFGEGMGSLRVFAVSHMYREELFVARGSIGDFWIPAGITIYPTKKKFWVSIL